MFIIQVSHIFRSILDQLSHDSVSCGEDECSGNVALQFQSFTAAKQKHAASKSLHILAAVGVPKTYHFWVSSIFIHLGVSENLGYPQIIHLKIGFSMK